MPTAPVAAGSLIASWAVVEASGSRAAGGAVLAAGGMWCVGAWTRRHGRRRAAALGGAGVGAFAASHLLGLVVGPWPAVLIVAAGAGALAWSQADALERRGERAQAPVSG